MRCPYANQLPRHRGPERLRHHLLPDGEIRAQLGSALGGPVRPGFVRGDEILADGISRGPFGAGSTFCSHHHLSNATAARLSQAALSRLPTPWFRDLYLTCVKCIARYL